MKQEEMYPLKVYLSALKDDAIELTFSQVEEILGGISLDPSAYRYAQWWTNGGHSHCRAWMDAGFHTRRISIRNQKVSFFRVSGNAEPCGASVSPKSPEPAKQVRPAGSIQAAPVPKEKPQTEENPGEGVLPQMTVCGYPFRFLQNLVPDLKNGQVIRDQPQKRYENWEKMPLHSHGDGEFCHFTIQAGPVPGVYLWVSQGEILYIGETVNLQQRFNTGYGKISPRNCFIYGQTTNCKMNKVVMEYYEQGHPIALYFYETGKYKKVELELLRQLNTKYNVKDN